MAQLAGAQVMSGIPSGVLLVIAVLLATGALVWASPGGRRSGLGAGVVALPVGVAAGFGPSASPIVLLSLVAAIAATVTLAAPDVPRPRRTVSGGVLVLAAPLFVLVTSERSWRPVPLATLTVLLLLLIAAQVAVVVATGGDRPRAWQDRVVVVGLLALPALTVVRTLAPAGVLADGGRRLPADLLGFAGAVLGLSGRSSSLLQLGFAAAVAIVAIGSVGYGVMRSPFLGRLLPGSIAVGLIIDLLVTRSRGGFDTITVAAAAEHLAPVVMLGVAAALATVEMSAAPSPGSASSDRDGARTSRLLAMAAVVGLLTSAHVAAVQWQAVDLIMALMPVDRLIGTDRSLEVIGWSVLAVVALRHGPRPVRHGRAAIALVGTTLLLLGVHGAVSVLEDGLRSAPLRPIALLGAVVLAARLGPRVLAAVFLAAASFGLGASIAVGMWGWPGAFWEVGRSVLPAFDGLASGRLKGLYPHPNTLGAYAALWILIAFSLRSGLATSRRRGLALAIGLVGVAVLIATDSRTAMLAAALGLIARLAVPLVRALPPATRPWSALAGGLTTTALPFVLLRRLEPGALNSRVHVWQETVAALAPRELFTGVGPEPLLRSTAFTERFVLDWPAGDSHNLTVELLLVSGVAGLVAGALFFSAILWVALETVDQSNGWSLALASTALVLAFGEVFFVHGPGDGRDVLLIVVGLLLAWSHSGVATAGSLGAQHDVAPRDPLNHRGDSPRLGEG